MSGHPNRPKVKEFIMATWKCSKDNFFQKLFLKWRIFPCFPCFSLYLEISPDFCSHTICREEEVQKKAMTTFLTEFTALQKQSRTKCKLNQVSWLNLINAWTVPTRTQSKDNHSWLVFIYKALCVTDYKTDNNMDQFDLLDTWVFQQDYFPKIFTR